MKILFSFLVLSLSTNCILSTLLNQHSKSSGAMNAILLALGGASSSAGSPDSHEAEPAGGGEVTSSGTTLRSTDGMLTIDIPEGAVTETLEFSISKYTPATSSYPGSYIPTSSAYEITPSYRFKKPVSVSLSLNTSTIQGLNLSKAKSLGFSYSTTSPSDNSGRFPSWMAHDTTVSGDKVVFSTQTFSIFGTATPPPGNQPPINSGAYYYFKAGCDYLPYMLRTQVIDPDGDSIQVYLITGPGNGGAVAIPMTREGVTNWYSANIPYEAMSASGIQMQISASDSNGLTTFVPSTGIFKYPASSNDSLFISNFNRDKDGDGLLCAWEKDNGKSDSNASDAAGVADTDGDGIPNVSDYTPSGEANPPIDFLQIFPANASLDLTEKIIFGVTASYLGSPRYVNASYATTGIGLNGSSVGVMNLSSFLPSVPGTAGVVAIVGALNSTAAVIVADTLGPNDITTLTANTLSTNKIHLEWTAPGDDGAFGRAVAYQIYRSTTAISNNTNCNGVLVNHTLVPKTAGVTERLDVSGLAPNTTYFFCIRAVDDNGNFNVWNGTVFATTFTAPDLTSPSDISSVTATTLGVDKVKLDWNAVGDDGNTGAATNYEIYRSTSPIITDAQCRSAVFVPNDAPSSPSGTPLSYTVKNLADNTIYYFCIVAVDESNNYSSWNGIATATTLRKNLQPTISLVSAVSNYLPNSVILDASASADPDAIACGANAANYVFSWTLLNKPPTSTLTSASFSGGNTKVATLTPDVAGEYTAQFSFTDDKGNCGGSNSLNASSVVMTITQHEMTLPTVFVQNVINKGLVESGFLIGTASDNVLVSSVEVSIDGGSYALATGTTNWKFKLPSGSNTWRDNSAHTLRVRSVDSVGNVSPVILLNVRKGKNKDINGDGYGDLAVGNYNSNKGGKVYIFHSSGSPGITTSLASAANTIITKCGNACGGFGVGVALGDVNGDGFSDVIVGDNYDDTTWNFGHVYVFHSTGNAGVTATNASAASSSIVGTEYSEFGIAIESGDINGDGYADVVAGTNIGKTYIFHSSGPSGITINVNTSATRIFTDSSSSISVSLGDVNGDGFSDLIIGNFNGKAFILNSSGNSGILISSLTAASTTIVGETSLFGSITSVGDVNGDGFMDAIIADASYNNNQGRIYIFHSSGSSGVTITSASLASSKISGETPATGLGGNVYRNGLVSADINGDGYSDIFVSGMNYNSNLGRTYVLNSPGSSGFSSVLSVTSSLRMKRGEGVNNFFGNSISVPDINGDGIPDLVVAASESASTLGRVYTYNSSANLPAGETSDTASTIITGPTGDNSFGTALSR